MFPWKLANLAHANTSHMRDVCTFVSTPGGLNYNASLPWLSFTRDHSSASLDHTGPQRGGEIFAPESLIHTSKCLVFDGR